MPEQPKKNPMTMFDRIACIGWTVPRDYEKKPGSKAVEKLVRDNFWKYTSPTRLDQISSSTNPENAVSFIVWLSRNGVVAGDEDTMREIYAASNKAHKLLRTVLRVVDTRSKPGLRENMVAISGLPCV